MQLNHMTPAIYFLTHLQTRQIHEHLAKKNKTQSLRLAAIQISLKPEANQCINATLTGTAKHLALGSRIFPHTHTHTTVNAFGRIQTRTDAFTSNAATERCGQRKLDLWRGCSQ